jgi:hypothetical protein
MTVLRTSMAVPTTGTGVVKFLFTTLLVMAAVYRFAPLRAFVEGDTVPPQTVGASTV